MAIANDIPFLEPGDLHTRNEGEAAVAGSNAVIAPGTGLLWAGTTKRRIKSVTEIKTYPGEIPQ